MTEPEGHLHDAAAIQRMKRVSQATAALLFVAALTLCGAPLAKGQTFYYATAAGPDLNFLNIYSGEVGGTGNLAFSLAMDGPQDVFYSMEVDSSSNTIYFNLGSRIVTAQTNGANVQTVYTLSSPGNSPAGPYIGGMSLANGLLYHTEYQDGGVFGDSSWSIMNGSTTLWNLTEYWGGQIGSLLMLPEAGTAVMIAGIDDSDISPFVASFEFPDLVGGPVNVGNTNAIQTPANSTSLTYYQAENQFFFTDGNNIYSVDLDDSSPSVQTVFENVELLDSEDPQAAVDMQIVGDTLYLLTNDGMNEVAQSQLWSYDLITGDMTQLNPELGNTIGFRVVSAVPEPSSALLALAGLSCLIMRRRTQRRPLAF